MRHTTAHRRLATLAATATAAALATTFLAPPASAVEWDVVASGLDNPRQLSFSGRHALRRRGRRRRRGPCVAGPEGADVCLGLTGAVTRVRTACSGGSSRGLPSLAAEDGSGALGPADVRVLRRQPVHRDRRASATTPPSSEELGWRGRRLGTVLRGAFPDDGPRIVANIAQFEANHDPDGLGPDTNPTGLTCVAASGYVLTDSGGNTPAPGDRRPHLGRAVVRLARQRPGGRWAASPIQPVPTSVAVGPDGAFYVSELTGFPFLPDIARIHRVVPGMPSSVYATGLTNVTDLGWHDGQLYAVQIADGGLMAGPIGSLVRGQHERQPRHRRGRPVRAVRRRVPSRLGVRDDLLRSAPTPAR